MMQYDAKYVGKAVEVVPWSGCWIWMQRLDKEGYGSYGGHGKNARAHRLAYKLWRGEIPTGKILCHTCDTPCCVNPFHLYPGTDKSNAEDKVKRGRHPRGRLCGWAKLSESDVREIRSSLEPQKVCAKRFGIGQMQVSRIRRLLRWAHID